MLPYYILGYSIKSHAVLLPREVVHREMSFYKIPIYDEQEVNVFELPTPTNTKEKLHMLLNYPKSSSVATFLSIADCALIFISV